MDDLISIAGPIADTIIASFDIGAIQALLATIAAISFIAAGYVFGRRSGRKAESDYRERKTAHDNSIVVREMPGMALGSICQQCGAGQLSRDESVRLVVCSNMDCTGNAPMGFVKNV